MEKLHPMSNALYIFFVLGALAIVGLAMPGPLKDHFRGKNNIDISLTEDNKTITLTAWYPKNKAKYVHEYVINHFGFTDLSDMSAVEVRAYHTPDSAMYFDIKSSDGHLKIAMNRLQNSQAAYETVKTAAKGIGQTLAAY